MANSIIVGLFNGRMVANTESCDNPHARTKTPSPRCLDLPEQHGLSRLDRLLDYGVQGDRLRNRPRRDQCRARIVVSFGRRGSGDAVAASPQGLLYALPMTVERFSRRPNTVPYRLLPAAHRNATSTSTAAPELCAIFWGR